MHKLCKMHAQLPRETPNVLKKTQIKYVQQLYEGKMDRQYTFVNSFLNK